MPHLPSLAALSLDAHPTSVVVYDDPTVNPSEIPETQEFNVLLIQDGSLLNVFGIDPTTEPNWRMEMVEDMQEVFFDPMKRAVLEGLVFFPDSSARFFKMDSDMGPSTDWDNAFNSGSRLGKLSTHPALTYLSSGTFNSTYRVDIDNLPPVSKNLLDGVVPSTTRHVVLRTSMGLYETNQVLKELVMQARMSELQLGPTLHVAWCIPLETRTTYRGVRIGHVCSIIELFHGDLHDVFFVNNDKTEGRLNMDVQTGAHGFWEAVARCIVRGAKHGVVHFDLKGENMLYKKVEHPGIPGDYHYEVRYTDFDSRFFKIMDIENEVIKSRQFCLGMLSLCQLLAASRCIFRTTIFTNERNDVVIVDWASVFQIALTAFRSEYNRVHKTGVETDLADLCSFDEPLKWGGSPSLDGTKKVLDDTLRRWARHYLDASQLDCVEIKENDRFAEIVQKVLQFAAGGSETRRAPAAGAFQTKRQRPP